MKLTKHNKKYHYFFKRFPTFTYKRISYRNNNWKKALKGTKLLKKILRKKDIKIEFFFSNSVRNVNPRTVWGNEINNLRFSMKINNIPCVMEYYNANTIVYIDAKDSFSLLFSVDDYVKYHSNSDMFTSIKGHNLPVLNQINFDTLTEEQEFQYSTLVDNLELYKETRRICKILSTENLTWNKFLANI